MNAMIPFLTILAVSPLTPVPTSVAAVPNVEPVFIHAAIMPDPEDETASFRNYNFTTDAYLRCDIILLDGAGEPPPSINAVSLATIRQYIEGVKNKDLTLFLNSCFPLPTYQKERTEQKERQTRYFDFWSARFRPGLEITLSYALLYGDSVFYLLLQKDPAAPDGIHHVEVIETKPCSSNTWRCAIGEYAQVKTSIIAAFAGCAVKPPLPSIEHLDKYVEIPVMEARNNNAGMALLLPEDQTGANAEALRAGCAVANQFADLLRGIGDKGSLDAESKEELKHLCTQGSINMLMSDVKTLESPALAGNPNSFRNLWLALADLYTVDEVKCTVIPAGNITVLWAMNKSKAIQQIELKKEKDGFLICGVGGEHDDLADFLNDGSIYSAAVNYIDTFGISEKP